MFAFSDQDSYHMTVLKVAPRLCFSLYHSLVKMNHLKEEVADEADVFLSVGESLARGMQRDFAAGNRGTGLFQRY